MAHKYDHLRVKARELRQKGHTLPEIMDMLQLPRTTVYGWIADIEIHLGETEGQKRRREAATKANQEKHAKLREAAYQDGLAQAPTLFQDPLFRDFINMYLGEGTKKARNLVEIVNSNAGVIKLSHYWMQKLAKAPDKLRYRIQYHQDQDIDEIRAYWGQLLNLAPERIKVQRKSNSNQLTGRKFRSVYGVLAISTSDTYFRSRLQAWLDFLEKQWVDL